MIGPAVWRSVGAERCANWFAGGAGSRHIKTPTLVGGPNVWGERRFSNPVERGEEFLTCDLKALGYLGVSSTCVAIDGVNGSLLEGSSGEAVNFESKVLESTSVVRPRGLLFV